MKNIKNILAVLVVALIGLSLTACSKDELGTNQYQGGVSLNAYGPNPVMRGGQLRFVGSNLDQIASIQIPGVSAITNFDVVKSGVPSEIRVTVPKDGPTEGVITLTTKTDQTITCKSALTYTEPIEFESFSPAAAMPGDIVTIKGDYLNLIYSLAFADGVVVGAADFKSHDRYTITVAVPEEAKTGKIELYTADLTVSSEEELDYQIITAEDAIEIGTPTITSITGRNTAEAQGEITAKAGETISITGTYFNVVADVTVGGVSVTDLKIANDGKGIIFTLPAEAPDGDIVIKCKSGVEVPVGSFVSVKPTECVATPNPVKAGEALQIDGKDMDLVVDVEFADAKGEYTIAGNQNIINTTQAYAVTVPETATEGTLMLVMANGSRIDVPFTLVKPTVTGYTTSSVSAGGQLTIVGTELDLVKTVQFGDGSEIVNVENATVDAITVNVPMNAASGAPILTLANGTTVANVPEITIEEAVFCYITEMPGEDVELKAGYSMTVTVANGDKLTGVEMNGVSCQYILTGENSSQLIIGIPETASASSKLRLISSNGEITYDITVIPATSVNKTIWSGLKQITWSDGGRVLIPATAFEGVPAGAVMTFCYTQVDQQWDQAQVNYGDWSGINFNEAGEGVVTFNGTLVPTDIYGWFSDGILNRETSVILTQEILDNIQAKKGGAEGGDGYGIIIQGSGLTFSKVTIAYEISLEQDLKNCIVRQDDQSVLFPYPINMTWDDAGRFRLLIDRDPAIKDMKLIAGKSAMYFYTTGTGMLQINDANWSSLIEVSDWNNGDATKRELILTADLIDWLKGNKSDGWSSTGLIIQGSGFSVTKITILP